MGVWGIGETEQEGKRTPVHGQQWGDCRVEGGVRGLNGNGKNNLKNKVHTHKTHITTPYLLECVLCTY